MSTSTLIAEILVIGATFLFGMSLIILGVVDPALGDELGRLSSFENMGIAVALLGTALAYHVGWVVNGTTSLIFRRFELAESRRKFSDSIRNLGQSETIFRDIQITLLSKGTDALIYDLNADITQLRLSRAGVVNFTLIAIGLLLHDEAFRWAAPLVFLLAIASARTASRKMGRLFEKMAMIQMMFEGGRGNERPTAERAAESVS